MRRVIATALLLVGCGEQFPTPFTAADMAATGSGEALVHYLRQPGATAAVCDRTSKGPRFTGSSAADFAALSGALIDGEVRSELWQRCAMLLLESADAEDLFHKILE